MELIEVVQVIDRYRVLQNTKGSSEASVFLNDRRFLDRLLRECDYQSRIHFLATANRISCQCFTVQFCTSVSKVSISLSANGYVSLLDVLCADVRPTLTAVGAFV